MRSATFNQIILLFLLLAYVSCKKDTKGDNNVQVTSISKITAGAGDTIVITGNNLLSAGSPEITLNGQVFNIISSTNQSLSIIVPRRAGSGKITVKIGGNSYTGPEIFYRYKATVTTVAGTGEAVYRDGDVSSAAFRCPWGIAVDADKTLYVADSYDSHIRIISPNGLVSSLPTPLAVNGVPFAAPYNIALDRTNHILYISDFNYHIFKVNEYGDASILYTGEPAITGIALGKDGYLYYTNNVYGSITRLSLAGVVDPSYQSGYTTVTPRNIVFDSKNEMYVPGYDPTTKSSAVYDVYKSGVSTILYTDPKFTGWEIAVDKAGNFYEADHASNTIRMREPDGNIFVLAGSGTPSDVDGIGLKASFNGPQGMAMDDDGNIYVSTFNYQTGGGNKIRKIVVE